MIFWIKRPPRPLPLGGGKVGIRSDLYEGVDFRTREEDARGR